MRSSASTSSMGQAAATRGGDSTGNTSALGLALTRSPVAAIGASALLETLTRRCELPALTIGLIVHQVLRGHPQARRAAVVEHVCDALGVHAGLIEALARDDASRGALPRCTRAVLDAVATWPIEQDMPTWGKSSAREQGEVIAVVAAARHLATLASGLLAREVEPAERDATPGQRDHEPRANPAAAETTNSGGEGHVE